MISRTEKAWEIGQYKILDFTEGREILREMLEPYVFSGSQILFHTEYLSKSYHSKILFNELKILEYDDYYYKLVNYMQKYVNSRVRCDQCRYRCYYK